MTVLFLANHFNTGGITTYIQTLARALIARGHTVIAGSSGGNMVPRLEALGARHVHLELNIKSEAHPRIWTQVPRMAGLIRTAGVDIVHAQTRVTQMSAALTAIVTGVPYVSTCHGFFNPHPGRRLFPLWGRRVIAISSPVREHLRRDLGVSSSKIVLVPNGIDLEQFTPLDREGIAARRRQWDLGGGPTLGIVARLSDVKGHEYLVEAMPQILKAVPNAVCLIFGDGPQASKIKAQIESLGLSAAVRMFPVIDRTAEVLPLMDVFVMPSVQEGLGLAVIEAAAMGVPAVVSRVGGLPDVVSDGETGLLVPSRDPQALAQAVVALLSDPGRARRMGLRARETACRTFSGTVMADATIDIYRQVLGERK
jgi:glycosyltransferase involved in cell wall biosynthesis